MDLVTLLEISSHPILRQVFKHNYFKYFKYLFIIKINFCSLRMLF